MRYLEIWLITGLLFSSVALADSYEHERYKRHNKHYDKRHHKHRRTHQPNQYQYREAPRTYYPGALSEYNPSPPAAALPRPAPAPAPGYPYYSQRSTQGAVGSAAGGALGYEMSGGDPLGAGVGAAAGAWFGNEMAR